MSRTYTVNHGHPKLLAGDVHERFRIMVMTNSKQKKYLMTDYPRFVHVAHCLPFLSEVE